MRKLDPVSLRLFVSTVEEGTIAGAAKRECIAAAAISKRLSELEEILGTVLLRRTNKGISPTAAGIALLYRARSALNTLNEIVDQMRDYADGTRGSVQVLANISIISQFIPDLFHSFLDAHPLIRINMEEKESLAITRAIEDNRADIGLFTKLPHGTDIEVHPFRTDRLVVVVPDGHPIAGQPSVTFRETLEHCYVALRSGTHLNFQLIKAANDLGHSLKIAIEVASYDAMFLLVRAGLGIAIMPEGSARNYDHKGVSIAMLDEPWAARELSICIRSKESLSTSARFLFDHLLLRPAN